MSIAGSLTRSFVLLAPAVVLAAALNACGGGGSGGDGGPEINVPEPDDGGPPPTAGADFLDTSSDVEKLLEAGALLSRSTPAFGSVTQSSNRDAAGVTTDRAETTWDGSRLTVKVERSYGRSMTFGGSFGNGETRLLESSTGNSQRFALLTVSWSDGDRTDYQAGGTWIHATGDPETHRYTSVEIGTFADGSGMSVSEPIELPASGSASYEGKARGYYGISYGRGFEDIPSGSLEYGTFSSTVELRADFGEDGSTVSGCINCDGGATVAGEYYEWDADNGWHLDEEDTFESAPIAMAFQDTAIGEDGAFSGNLFAVGDAGTAPDGFSVSDSVSPGFRISGTWGGVLSRETDSEGVPAGIVGTFGAEARHSLGTRAAFAGYFTSTLGAAMDLPDDDMNGYGQWTRIMVPGEGRIIPVGVESAAHGLFSRYDTGFINPTLSPRSADSQPAGTAAGRATWLGAWEGVYGDALEFADDGEARIVVDISEVSVEATLTYSDIDIPSIPASITTAPASVSDGRFAPVATIDVAGASVTFEGEGQFGGTNQQGVVGYVDGPGFRSVFYGDKQ